jgi:heparanase 1
VATRRARRDGPLRPDELDELATWAGAVEQARTTSAPAAELWLGETGGAQCGGEPGASDTWADALWWLDELGQLARRGETVVIRQTLVGGDYGLLSADDFTPRPSYWASWLWKQTMGATALAVDVSPRTPAVRAYAQCARTPGAVTVLLENLHATATATVRLAGLSGRRAAVHVLRAADAGAREVTLDGHPLGQHPPALAPTTQSASAPFEVPPLGVVFAMVEATSAVCP